MNTIVFIGGGNMATSLIAGLIADGHDPQHILASDPESKQTARLSRHFSIRTTDNNQDAASLADILVLAVKPQIAREVCQNLAQTVKQRRPLLISIVAGLRESSLQQWLGREVSLVRTMPNTPAMLQAGATVLHASKKVSADQRDLAESVMRSVGLTRWVDDEGQMDTVTALSGSGPAYFFLVMEAIEAAGIELGLDPETARLLTLQTALGAARMAMESRDSPAALRHKVTSPGGTTEYALKTLEQGELRQLFNQAIKTARLRSVELSAMLGNS